MVKFHIFDGVLREKFDMTAMVKITKIALIQNAKHHVFCALPCKRQFQI